MTIAGQASQALTPVNALLLACVALGGPRDRDALAVLLYPETPRTTRRSNLRQRLRQIRSLHPALLVDDGNHLALGPDVRHDLESPEQTLAANPAALTGSLLGNIEFGTLPEMSAWLRRARESWAERRRDVLTGLAVAREADGRINEALSYATRLVHDDPTHEHAVRLLMRLHFRRGDRGAALAVYERCVTAMHQQFGEAVSEETARLGDLIGREDRQAPAPVTPLPVQLRHPPRTIARDVERDAMHRRWLSCGVVVLTGPPGIGKTRLFDDFCRLAGLQRVVRLASGDAEQPLGLLRRIVRAAGVQAAGGEGRENLVAALTQALGAATSEQPLWLAVDDLHFADDESLEALCRLLPVNEPRHAVRWCLTCRDHPVPAPLAAWLDREDGPLPAEALVDMAPMTPDDVGAFAAALTDDDIDATAWGAALHRHCGGVPLHLMWVLRTLHEQRTWPAPQPPTTLPEPAELTRRLVRRLDGGDPRIQQLAFVAALAGPDFDARLARHIVGCSVSELSVQWRRLELAGVLRGRHFSHDLMRRAVLDSVPDAVRPDLHAEIAAALGDRPVSVQRRAGHWARADRPLQAAADYRQAAEEAMTAGLSMRAITLLEEASAQFERAGEPDAAFEAIWRAGRLRVARASAGAGQDTAVQLSARARDDRQRAMALSLLAYAKSQRHVAGGEDDASQALAHATAAGDQALQREALLRLCMCWHVAGRWSEVIAMLDRMDAGEWGPVGPLERPDLEDTRALALAGLGRRSAAVTALYAARDRALSAQNWERAADACSTVSVQLAYLCRIPEAVEASRAAIELSRRAGAEEGSTLIDVMSLAGVSLDQGRFGVAVELGEQAAEGLKNTGYDAWIANADNCLASVFAVLGRHDLAERRLRELPPDAPLWTRVARQNMRASLYQRRTGKSPLAHYDKVLDLLTSVGEFVPPMITHSIATERARWMAPADGWPLVEAAARWAAENEHVALQRIVLRAQGEILRAAGDLAGAARTADALFDHFGGQWHMYNGYLPEYWKAMIEAWDGVGDQQRTETVLDQAIRWIDERVAHDVPDVFRVSFLESNRANRWLMRRAGRA
ncbi:ATP-binding protein [Rubrivivax albus]|uniref:ATP-binding protein n=1 Tax=Rubrivivax albus TaxID=2499835 RepID=UPI0013051822|nr:BTAD domain-containing putative transcriptional regulator [Rubrivivax albus]